MKTLQAKDGAMSVPQRQNPADQRPTRPRTQRPARQLMTALALAAGLTLAACSGSQDDTGLVESARDYMLSQDYNAAIIQLKTALDRNANNAESRLLLGRALMETGDPQSAGIELRKALELGADPNDVQPLLARSMVSRGEFRQVVTNFADTRLSRASASAELKAQVATAYAGLGDPRQAEQWVASALSDEPLHIGARLLRSRLTASQGDIAAALREVDQVLSGSSNHLAALLLKGELQRMGLRDQTAAQATYAQAVQAHPRAATAHAALVSMLMERGEVDAARVRHAAMQSAVPQHPETLLFEAQFAYLDGNFQRTRELTEQLLRVFPEDVRTLQLAGVTELRLNNLTQAEAHLGRVMKALPEAPVPRQLLARIYNRTGQPGKALEVLQPLVTGANADSNSLTLAGEALLQTGDMARAEAAFARAARGNPQATTARAALALGQVARGNASAGFAELEAAAAADPGIRSNMALIAARMRTNDSAGALRAIDELQKKQPDSPVAHALRGSVLLQRRDTAGAANAFEQALQIDPLYYAATAGLAAIDLAAGRPEGAEKRFRDLLQRDPRNTRALLGLAELKARTGGSKDEVTAAITAAVRANPGEFGPRVLLVNHLLSHRDPQAALAAAQEATSSLPNSVEVMDALGSAQLAAGQNQQAVTTFTRLAGLRPDRPEVEMRLAEAHLANNDMAAARRALNKALDIRPNFVPAYRALVQLALREDNPRDAVAAAQRLQRREAQDPAGFLLEGEVHLSRQQADAAIAPLRKALDLGAGTDAAIRLHGALTAANRAPEAERFAAGWTRDKPRDAAFRFYLGDRALSGQDYRSAEAHYRSVLQVQPDNALALNNVAWLMAQQKKPGALPLAERANQLLPNQPALMDTLAWVLALENQVPRAVELQRQAMAKAPEDHNLRLTLAKIHLQGGDKAQARTELQTLAALGDKFGNQREVAQLLGTL
jgi:cellulose synthase operon protein C